MSRKTRKQLDREAEMAAGMHLAESQRAAIAPEQQPSTTSPGGTAVPSSRYLNWRWPDQDWQFLGTFSVVVGEDVEHYNLFFVSVRPYHTHYKVQKVTGDGAIYDTFVWSSSLKYNGKQPNTCSCPASGHRRGESCRHIAAVLKLQAIGRLR